MDSEAFVYFFMVIENPIELTIFNAVLLVSGFVFVTTRVENKCESAITTQPQKIKILLVNPKGDTKQ